MLPKTRFPLIAVLGEGNEFADELERIISADPAPDIEAGRACSCLRHCGLNVRRSEQDMADFSVTMVMDMTAALRKKSDLQAAGKRVSLNDLIILAAARTLVSYSDLNAQVEGGPLRPHHDIDVGLALSTDEGLYLPVVHHADKLCVEAIAAETVRLAVKVQKKQITEANMAGGAFTVSNLGMFGVESFTAIIVPPQTGILSVGRVVDRPVRGDGDRLAWRPAMAATLTVDQRVVDGLGAAKFLRDLKAQLAELCD